MIACPKCKSPMHPVEAAGVEVDRCTSCSGLWFDLGESEALLAAGEAKSIDTGEANAQGHQRYASVHCPRCKVPMINMVVNGQPHIRFEGCTTCHGQFFDAGEFRDAGSLSFFERITSLFVKNAPVT